MSQTPSNLLIELGTEELPPANLKKLSDAFSQNILKGLVDAGLTSQHKPQSFATPRRLGVLVKGVSPKQSDREIERVGPPVKAATDGDGNPTKVGLGFARSVGFVVTDISSARLQQVRQELPALANRRPEIYGDQSCDSY